jgi:hypothetical protein
MLIKGKFTRGIAEHLAGWGMYLKHNCNWTVSDEKVLNFLLMAMKHPHKINQDLVINLKK